MGTWIRDGLSKPYSIEKGNVDTNSFWGLERKAKKRISILSIKLCVRASRLGRKNLARLRKSSCANAGFWMQVVPASCSRFTAFGPPVFLLFWSCSCLAGGCKKQTLFVATSGSTEILKSSSVAGGAAAGRAARRGFGRQRREEGLGAAQGSPGGWGHLWIVDEANLCWCSGNPLGMVWWGMNPGVLKETTVGWFGGWDWWLRFGCEAVVLGKGVYQPLTTNHNPNNES